MFDLVANNNLDEVFNLMFKSIDSHTDLLRRLLHAKGTLGEHRRNVELGIISKEAEHHSFSRVLNQFISICESYKEWYEQNHKKSPKIDNQNRVKFTLEGKVKKDTSHTLAEVKEVLSIMLGLEESMLLQVDKTEKNDEKQDFSLFSDALNRISTSINDDICLLGYKDIGDSLRIEAHSNERNYISIIAKGAQFNSVQKSIDELNGVVQKMQEAIKQGKNEAYLDEFIKASYSTYSLLLNPVSFFITGYKRLYIKPSESLKNVNFNLLIQSNKEAKSFSELDYLMNHHEVATMPSFKAFFHQQKVLEHGKRAFTILKDALLRIDN
ncbi:hypothetical protein [Lewinella sp. W8]|uniref:hypothetical protein n=1 Tax=Lewinella sp. W8 TaxID=2528208 RepID=UPI00106765DA|nr:hypothetical protein [Lewinella sp. W8]MTB49811.1 hypothetical protein [Lewinella sp. W8]